MLNQKIDEQFERLITSGGDNRLLLDSQGLNRYGCGPGQHTQTQFGSCTCSSPSKRALEVARQLHLRLKNADNPAATASQQFEIVRDQIRHLLELPAGVDIALTPSGTDVEMIVLALAASHTDQPIANVIIGPSEVGSGTRFAAGIQYFDSLVPIGRTVNVQQPVDIDLASRVSVFHVDVRDPAGRQLSIEEIDSAVTEAVIDAAKSGSHVIVHLVAHSKTGINAPSIQTIASIKANLKEDVTVVVDAAQGRLAAGAYQNLLDNDCLVAFTGSKFFSGPPFCGALLVPKNLRPGCLHLNQLPESFRDFFNRDSLPPSWKHLRSRCSTWTNFGLLFRWVAAVAEMTEFYEVEADIREVIFASFANEVVNSALASRQCVITPLVNDQEKTLAGISSYQSVFSFEIKNLHDGFLSKKQTQEVHRRINTDPKYGFVLGQPVQIGQNRSVLRIALGSPMVVAVASDLRLGKTLDHRLTWLRNQIRSCFNAVDSIVTCDNEFAETASFEYAQQ